MVRRIAGLENPLARRKLPRLNLHRQNACFVIVKKREKWNVP
jgi:hypothetical protein